MPNQQAEVARRTCDICARKFRSIRARLAHALEAHPGTVADEDADYVRNTHRKATMPEFLQTIMAQQTTQAIVRGPKPSEIARELRVTVNAVRKRLEEAAKHGYVAGDHEAGFIVTPVGAYAAFHMKED